MPHVSYLEESTKAGKGWMLFGMAKKSAQSDADYSGAPDHTHRNLTNTRCAAAVAEVSRAGRTDSEVSPPHEHIEPSLETEHRAPSPIAGRTRNKTKLQVSGSQSGKPVVVAGKCGVAGNGGLVEINNSHTAQNSSQLLLQLPDDLSGVTKILSNVMT